MAVSFTATIHELGTSLLERCRDGGDDLALQLCAALEPLLSPDFRIGFVGVTGDAGNVLIERALLIYTKPSAEQEDSAQHVAPETVAGVLHVAQRLNEDSLAEGYALIGKVKALPGHETDSVEGCMRDTATYQQNPTAAQANSTRTPATSSGPLWRQPG